MDKMLTIEDLVERLSTIRAKKLAEQRQLDGASAAGNVDPNTFHAGYIEAIDDVLEMIESK
jgi:hypothetical protein